ncbi:hypothetical protein PAXRUDRAFT_144538 [Paxillus rubicundulus Ve08.2h10]|uniref:Unplaced genomic scaffold scaffold_343, whole genome shotgun sequence n=1 Tax=Paxillus rubicundulus Ve08.2h10 TaxID=930991 RepID=A0A0D0DVR0_9AGAM|nr:hypothetical protein PAXRUDRAFT_144538 [Paxillus rubicundulus Ve08.2h10]
MSFSSHHSKHQWLTQSGCYCSGSGSVGPSTSTVPSRCPSPAFYWSTEGTWTPADQADWETALARFTASAGLPLRWIEDPEWKKICDCFLPKAKNLSSKVLTDWIIPKVLSVLKVSAQLECQGLEATLQCNGWTGEDHHHLIEFMMTAQQKANISNHLLHTIHVHNASKDPKTAEELLKQMLLAISSIKTEWGVTIVACTMDASGESAKAWRLLWQKLPHLVVPNCLAHQWNLIVGDLFKVKDDYEEYGDMAQELITWL